MPSVLITTSRRTSNRVRSFVRDLSTVIPDSERFNRGSLNQEELFARVHQTGAQAIIVVTIFRGNPDALMFYNEQGDLILEVNIESAILRREVNRTKTPRIHEISYLCVRPESNEETRILSNFLSSLFNVDAMEMSDIPLLENGDHQAVSWLESTGSRIIWTYYHARTGNEIGPRVRIKSIKSNF